MLSITSKTTRLNWAAALATVLFAFVALPAYASATTYSMNWASPHLIENPQKGGALASVSCAPVSTKLKNPPLMCVAGDTHGSIWATAHPSKPVSGWHRANIDTGANGGVITGISCPATTLCVAVDSVGQVMHSTQPTGGKATWTKPIRVDTGTQPGGGYAGFSAISCPTISLCVAVDNSVNGQVAYTTDPRGPASAWKLATIGTSVTLSSVSCSSTTLCVIGGAQHYYSTTPTGGATAWKATGGISTGASVIASLSCNTIKLCVGVGYGNAGSGLAGASSVPTTSTWTLALVGGSNPPARNSGVLDSVSCPQRNFCVAVDSSSNAYYTNTPVRGDWTSGKALKKASLSTLSAVSCNAKLCVEVDNRGTTTYGVVKSAGAPTTTSTSTTTTTTPTTTTTTKTTTTG